MAYYGRPDGSRASGGGSGMDPAAATPGILLKAKKLNLALNFYYTTRTDTVTPYGAARSASVMGRVLSSTSSSVVTIRRGDFSEFNYSRIGTSGGITTYMHGSLSGGSSTIIYDGTQFTEIFTDGTKMIYQAQVGGGNPVTHELIGVQDRSGNAHTYAYGSGAEAGLLKTIQVPDGNRLTLSYAPGTSTSLADDESGLHDRGHQGLPQHIRLRFKQARCSPTGRLGRDDLGLRKHGHCHAGSFGSAHDVQLQFDERKRELGEPP